jgi:hypothetical protein
LLPDQAGALQRLQVKGKRGRLQADALADDSCRQTTRALPHQKPVNGKAILVRERRQCVDDSRGFHARKILREFS